MKYKNALLAATALCAVAARSGDATSAPTIAEALAQLDPTNDADWTADGQPRIDRLKSLTGDQTLNRAAIETAKPGYNREAAGGENRPGGSTQGDTIGAALLGDGWQPHPDAEGYSFKGSEVRLTSELHSEYAAKSAPSGGGQQADQPSDHAQDISGQTGLGGATTARSPAPIEGEPRKTHVSEPSQGEPGERPVGVTQGVTDSGVNHLGTPEGTVENAGRAIELSGEVAARSAGSVLTPTQAPADGSNTPSISLGGAADPLVEANAPGGSVLAEGADTATFFEGATVGGPFGHSGITVGGVPSEAELGSLDHDFDGDPDEVAALESELASAEAESAQLREQADDVSNRLHTSLRTEAAIRRKIAANTPRSGNMTTIQAYLRSSQERRAANVAASRK